MADGQPASSGATRLTTGSASAGDSTTTGELLVRLSEQSSRLVRDELALLRVEMTEKAKHAGIGAGLFSTAGILALFGFGTVITTAILALALVLPAWLSALIVAIVLFAAAGIAALIGKKHVQQATPAAPEQTIDNVKRDVQEVQEARSRDHTV